MKFGAWSLVVFLKVKRTSVRLRLCAGCYQPGLIFLYRCEVHRGVSADPSTRYARSGQVLLDRAIRKSSPIVASSATPFLVTLYRLVRGHTLYFLFPPPLKLWRASRFFVSFHREYSILDSHTFSMSSTHPYPCNCNYVVIQQMG